MKLPSSNGGSCVRAAVRSAVRPKPSSGQRLVLSKKRTEADSCCCLRLAATTRVGAMGTLNGLAYLIALVIAAGEIARFWASERFIPMALDELLVAAALVWAAWRSRVDGAGGHLAAWGAFCALALVLLVQTVDHQTHGPAKAARPIYLTALGAMLIVGLWAVRRALQLVRRDDGRR